MEHTLFLLTSVLLLAGWLLLELVLRRRVLRGTILEAVPAPVPLAGLLATDFAVRLDDGREVTARASGCVQCLAQLARGSRVALLPSRDGYVITLPWLRRASTCGAGD